MKHFLNAFRPLAEDFLSTIFFVAFYAITGSVKLGIIFGIAVGVAQIGCLLVRRRKIDLMQWLSLALVIVLGGATLLTHNARFVMIKPSIGTFAVGCVMLRRNWMGRYLPPIVSQNVSETILVGWGYVWSALMFVLAAANLFVAFRLGTAAWAWFVSIVPLTCQILLFSTQYASLRFLVRRNIRARVAGGEELSRILAS
jgi:intracellular septation protein